MTTLTVLFGGLIGLSLGLTGGGGSIFAVPLLVYGLGMPAREAVGVSLAAVGATAFVGFVRRLGTGQVEVRTGLMFAAAGMLGAPAGTWLAGIIPEAALLALFAGLMVVVALRMWRQAAPPVVAILNRKSADDRDGPACRRDADGNLLLTSRCAFMLMLVGVGTGVLSGLFGVGGGFVIVPALVLFSGMSMHRAVGTSLLVIALVGASGVTADLLAGRDISPAVTALFAAGGVAGLLAGDLIGGHLSGRALQRVFAAAILGVAAFVIVRNVTF
jgi:uncharacterized protein